MKWMLGLALAAAMGPAQAQDYPTKPIHVLVPFAPGGAVDTTARVLALAMQQRVNWQFVIENRPGGNGFIATTAVQKAAPDGYTLLMAHTGEFAVNPALFDNVPYELERDFLPITMVSDSPMLYLANVNAPFNSFQELVAQAKAKPGSISFSSAGNGSINHLAGEWLAQAAGIQLLHVPYKGGAPAAAAVAAGDVQFGVMAVPGAAPHLKSGRGKVIGITTAKKSPLDPSWATPRDAGIPDLDASIWVGLFAPKGTPQAVVDRVNKEVRQTLGMPDVQKRFIESAGGEAVGMTPAEFLARIKSDAERYRRVVQKAGVKPG
ncbi:MAG TPA: tripartite tricarboxylate transporter substrate-binding protein [Burkholderiales bacterium]|nr:tripartite tricarboxylate transporter substrate-binding protein [Burkholderiales bacterium]